MHIEIPFKPREYQWPLIKAIDSGEYKKAFVLWHRRAGKDITLFNLIIKKAFQKVGMYFYFLPQYTQGKKIIWDGINDDGFRFINYIPKPLIKSQNGQEMKIELTNGSIIQIIGTDKYDAIRGTNPIGCVFSEYAWQNPMAWEVVKPILKVNKGWACFNTTPNGKNHAYDMFKMAENDPDWFSEVLTIDDTDILCEEDMEIERREGTPEELIKQEYYCSFDVGTLGNYYAVLINETRDADRICALPVMKDRPVDLFLDLGKNDSTSILFTQVVGKEIRIVDFYEANGKDIAHYCQYLRRMKYDYGDMWLPHDAFNQRLESSKTIAEQFREAGFKIMRVQKAHIQHGIQEVRKIFPRIWFDKERCSQLVRSLENYHKEWDEKAKVFRNTPKHDWSSHASDAVRYMAIGMREKAPEDNYDKEAKAFADFENERTDIPDDMTEEYYEQSVKDLIHN